MRYPLFALGAVLLVGPAASQPSLPASPPVARRESRVEVVHDDKLVDEYFWLRRKEDPQVRAYLESENAYTDLVMKATVPLQEALYSEMLRRIKEKDLSVPYRKGNFYYYSRTEQGKQYPIQCRRRGSLEHPEEVFLDQNELAKGEKFFAVGDWEVSDDGNLLAYTTDVTGFREYTLFVRDLRSRKTA